MDLINNPMTAEDKKAFFEEYYRVQDTGTEEDVIAVLKKFPVDPALALAIKDVFGLQYLEGFNLAEAIEAYGEERLKN